MSVTINIVNSPPAAAGAAFHVHHDQTLYASGLGLMEFFADADHDDLTIAVLSDVSHGDLVLSNDGTLAYTRRGLCRHRQLHVPPERRRGGQQSGHGFIDVTNTKPTAAGMVYHVLPVWRMLGWLGSHVAALLAGIPIIQDGSSRSTHPLRPKNHACNAEFGFGDSAGGMDGTRSQPGHAQSGEVQARRGKS